MATATAALIAIGIVIGMAVDHDALPSLTPSAFAAPQTTDAGFAR
jgi:hypothetical protein